MQKAYINEKAQVAELVDAQVSGTCGRKAVEVRVFSWAPLTFGQKMVNVLLRSLNYTVLRKEGAK